MRFHITRTSTYGQKKPCKEAYLGEIMRVDARSTDAPHKIPAWSHLSEEDAMRVWLRDGSNHRIENGHITRDMGMEPCWFIDIPDLEALLAFNEEYGELVLSWSWRDGGSREIEIYDTWRE